MLGRFQGLQSRKVDIDFCGSLFQNRFEDFNVNWSTQSFVVGPPPCNMFKEGSRKEDTLTDKY